ncbi:hypothetical protein [Corallococcus sp. AB011P]|uniref:hypothetical protein n=1 Tax=Corallococcus sp. AB011P TaxID=2316735 RepID=UPI0011C3F6B0|nr:hypothetical protein [Corallococcus sp. AB011P]
MTSSKNHKREASGDPLADAKNALRGSKNALLVFNRLRRTVDDKLYRGLAAWLIANPTVSKGVFHTPFPTALSELKTHPGLDVLHPAREIAWMAAYCHAHAKALSIFAGKSLVYQKYVLCGEYAEAARVLSEIERSLGQSIWLIKNRVALFQLMGGLEKQKEYVKQVIKGSPREGVASFVAYQVSQGNEETVTPIGFMRRQRKMLAKHFPQELGVYLTYHIAPEGRLELTDVAHILRNEQSGTIIDGYEALVATITASVNSGHEALGPACKSAIQMLAACVDDARLLTIRKAIFGDSAGSDEGNVAVDEAHRLLLRGNYVESLRISMDGLRNDPSNPALLVLAAQASASEGPTGQDAGEGDNSQDGPLWRKIVEKLKLILSRTEDVEEATNSLLRWSLNFHGHAWANAIAEFVGRERSPEPGARLMHAAQYALAFGVSEPGAALPGMDSGLRHAFLQRYLDRPDGDELRIYAEALSGGTIPAALADGFCQEQFALLRAEHHLLASRFVDALAASAGIGEPSSTDRMYDRYRLRIQCGVLLRLGRIDECIELMGATFAYDYTMYDMLPLRDAAEAINGGVRQRLRSRLALAIVYDMYYEFVSRDLKKYIVFAYEDFLTAHGVARPSELSGFLDRFDYDQIEYFLANVCIESVMGKSIVFKGSREVTEERIAVCRLLLDMKSSQADELQAEIRELLGGLMVRRRLRDVEQRKIYVDLAGVVRTAETRLREDFNRYAAFLKHGVGTARLTTAAALAESKDKVKLVDAEGQARLSLPSNEAMDILGSIVARLRDEYVSSSAHGLDGYLSVRIRHGTLSGHLRSPVEAQKLITPWDEASGEYRPNEAWAAKFSGSTKGVREHIEARLGRFSRDFDEIVRMMLNEWIRVRRVPEDKGLFNFVFYETDAVGLAQLVGLNVGFVELVNAIFAMFGRRLEHSLKVVREAIERIAKSKVNDLLAELQSEISQIRGELDPRAFNDFSNAISAARTGVQVAFDRVVEWFRVSAATAQDPFSIEDAVRVSVESVRTATRVVNARISLNGTERRRLLQGILLPAFVDLFFIVFDNIVKHSATSSPHEANIQITYGDEKIHCLVESPIGAAAMAAPLRTRVEDIRTSMRESSNLAAVSREGGTGLLKIRKILTHDLQLPPVLDFGFREDRVFFVSFSIPVQMLAHGARDNG